MGVSKKIIAKKHYIKIIVFVSLAIIMSFVCVLGGLLDAHFGLGFFSVALKSLMIAAILLYVRHKNEFFQLYEGRYFTAFLLLAFVPGLIMLFSALGVPDHIPSVFLIVSTFLNILTTAAWEELFFRYVGKSLFETNGKYLRADFIMLSLVFAATHLVNLLFYSPLSVLPQVAVALSFGIFLFALYCKTKNIFVPITAHFFNNFAAGFFGIFLSDPSGRFFDGFEYVFTIAVIVFNLIAGLYIIIKSGILQKSTLMEELE